jgi:hypothetical protein
MGRKILAVIAAWITGLAIIMVIEMIGTMFNPQPPSNFMTMSVDEKIAYARTIPIGAYLTVLFGYILSSFAAGWLVTKISKQSHGLVLPLIVGGLLTLGAVFNAMWLPGQPFWFVLLSIIVFIPLAFLGHRVAQIYLRP